MFSASIPGKVYFKVDNKKSGYRTRYNRIRNDWSILPDDNCYQPLPSTLNPNTPKYLVLSSDDPDSKKYDIKNGYIEEDNQPIRLRLVGYASPGRPYDSKKYELIVATPNNMHFVMTHDVFLNAVLDSGLEPGGMLPGKYIFARFTKTVRPIQVDSGLHKAVLAYVSDMNKAKIKVKNMQVGDVYSTGAGNLGLFLGFVNTESMSVILPPGAERHFWAKTHSANDPLLNFGVKYKNKALLSLWMDLGNKNSGYNIEPESLRNQIVEAVANRTHYRFSVKEHHRYNDKISIKRTQVPEDVIQKIRNITTIKMREMIERDKQYRANPDMYMLKARPGSTALSMKPPDILRHYDACRIAEYSHIINMVPFGMKPIRSDLCKIFDRWNVQKYNNKSDKRSK